jgi:hypothetical protein
MKLLIVTLWPLIFINACSRSVTKAPAGNLKQQTTLSGIPLSGAIDLGRLFAPPGSNLALARPAVSAACEKSSVGGGILVQTTRMSCAATKFSVGALLGEEVSDTNADGIIACDEISKDKASDLLVALCDAQVDKGQDVKEASVTKADGKNLKISFSKAGSFDVAGSWRSASGMDLPALIRLWRLEDASTSPDIAMHVRDNSTFEFWTKADIKTVSNGQETIGEGRLKNVSIRAVMQNNQDTSKCADQPSSSTCLTQDVTIWFGSPAEVTGYQVAPDGYRVRVLADDAKSPSFLAVEGMYVMSDANARWASVNAQTNDGSGQTFFENARTFYFQVIRYQDEVWGRMVIRDANGAVIQGYSDYQGSPAVAAEEAGHCVALVSTDVVTTSSTGIPSGQYQAWYHWGFKSKCEKIDGSLPKFKAIWEGESKFAKPTAQSVAVPSGL